MTIIRQSAPVPLWLQGSFRMLFVGSATWALIVTMLWLGALTGRWTLPTAMAPLAWHQHEMLFGYLAAVIAGFLSAAVPNWTGRPVVTGWPVAVFVGLWAAARLTLLFSSVVSPVLAAILDVGFLLTLFGYAAWLIFATNNRNKPVLLVLLLFAAACGLDHIAAMGFVADPGIGMRCGFALVLLLIGIIGGRVIPAFTRNWLTRQGKTQKLPTMPNRFDHVAIAMLVVALAGWALLPSSQAVGALLLAAGVLHAVRLTRWAGLRAVSDPLVFVLHCAYAWLPSGLLLLGAAMLWSAVPVTSAMHALSAGAMATMTLAMMTRVIRGHTGRPLEADAATIAIYVLVNIGALVRIAAPVLPFDYMVSVGVAGGLWGGAFLVFVGVYGGMVLTK